MSIDELLKQTTPRPWRAVNSMDRWRVENAEFYICAMADNGRSGELDAEDAIAALKPLVTDIASIPEREHFLMLAAAIKRVRDDYGPHTNLTIIPANK